MRAGSCPVHGSRYLRSMVSVSSPEIDSSRSVTMLVLSLLLSRASEMIATGLPITGDSPKLVPMPARVGPAT